MFAYVRPSLDRFGLSWVLRSLTFGLPSSLRRLIEWPKAVLYCNLQYKTLMFYFDKISFYLLNNFLGSSWAILGHLVAVFALLSLCFRSAFALLSLCCRSAFVLLALCFRFAFALFSLCFRSAFALLSLCFCFAFAVFSLCFRSTFALFSICFRSVFALLSFCFILRLSMGLSLKIKVTSYRK